MVPFARSAVVAVEQLQICAEATSAINCDASAIVAELNGAVGLSERRTSSSPGFEVKRYIHVIGNRDKRDPLVHPIVFSVENHGSLNFARICTLARNGKGKLLWIGNSANGEDSIHFKGVWTCLQELCGRESNLRIGCDVKEILALQLAVFRIHSMVPSPRFRCRCG